MYIARQPIFKTNLEVFGYELLFRASEKDTVFGGASSAQATASVMTGVYESGIDTITNGKKAFVNFDGNLLRGEYPELLSPDFLVIEVLEDVIVDEELIEKIAHIKSKGYKIALDDFVEDPEKYPLMPYADIIKYDLILTPLEKIKPVIDSGILKGKILLAEKIESEDIFLKARDMGFKLFQGFFFSKPSIVMRSSMRKTPKVQYLRIINELQEEEPSYQHIAEIVEQDVDLAYRLMRIVSTRAGDDLVYSIKRALTYMGLKEIEKWINILMIQDLGSHKPKELTSLSLVRSKFAEQLAKDSVLKHNKFEASMLGLFSTLDAMLDEQMSEALEDISIPESIKLALLEKKGDLSPLYELILSYEMANFESAAQYAKTLNIDNHPLDNYYMESIKWADKIMKTLDYKD